MTGLTLPGMIEEPGCRSGMAISPRPVLGPEPIQRRSLLIFIRETAMVRSCAGRLDQAVAVGLGLEVVAGLGERQPGVRGEQLDHALREAGRGVDAGADGGAAERDLGDAGERGLDALDAVADLARRSRRTPGRG